MWQPLGWEPAPKLETPRVEARFDAVLPRVTASEHVIVTLPELRQIYAYYTYKHSILLDTCTSWQHAHPFLFQFAIPLHPLSIEPSTGTGNSALSIHRSVLTKHVFPLNQLKGPLISFLLSTELSNCQICSIA